MKNDVSRERVRRGATGRQMAGEASEAVAHRARPIRSGDTSIPGDRTHPGGRRRWSRARRASESPSGRSAAGDRRVLSLLHGDGALGTGESSACYMATAPGEGKRTMAKKPGVNLDLIAPPLRQAALAAFEEGDVLGFLGKAERGNTDWLVIVAANLDALQKRGLYEQALLCAWEGHPD